MLVERKELQSLQSEWRALFSRIDEAAAEARVPRALRGEVEFQYRFSIFVFSRQFDVGVSTFIFFSGDVHVRRQAVKENSKHVCALATAAAVSRSARCDTSLTH